jgi:hypothetical protein
MPAYSAIRILLNSHELLFNTENNENQLINLADYSRSNRRQQALLVLHDQKPSDELDV